MFLSNNMFLLTEIFYVFVKRLLNFRKRIRFVHVHLSTCTCPHVCLFECSYILIISE